MGLAAPFIAYSSNVYRQLPMIIMSALSFTGPPLLPASPPLL